MLKCATCYAYIAELFASITLVSFTNGEDCQLEALEGLRQVCFGKWWLKILGGSHRWPSSTSCLFHFICPSELLCIVLLHFHQYRATFLLINSPAFLTIPSLLFSHILSLSTFYVLFQILACFHDCPSCLLLFQPDSHSFTDASWVNCKWWDSNLIEIGVSPQA